MHKARLEAFTDGVIAIIITIKGKSSIVLYILGIALTFVSPWLGFATFACVALMWLVPDRRMHQAL